jgi:hypothetical protein
VIGRWFHVVGNVDKLAFDHLSEVLRACVTHYNGADGQVDVSADGTCLNIRTGAHEPLVLPNPLFYLHDFLDLPLPHQRSIIHGDLHVRNVIVSPRGMPYYIDFSEAGIGPTLFDFIKHEVSLWDWNLASPPAGAPLCTLAEAIHLMKALTNPLNRFPAPFSLLPCPKEFSERKDWLGKFYQSVGTLRSLAKQHCTSRDSASREKATDYFTPLCMYSSLVLRWCDPRTAETAEEIARRARRGLFVTALAGLLLGQGLTGVPIPQLSGSDATDSSVQEVFG